MKKIKVNAPVKIKSGTNKVYTPLESFIKGKRINFNKLLSDAGFNTSLTKEIRSFNERERYNAKKTGDTPRKFLPSEIKRKIKSGTLSTKEFRSFVNDISTSTYRQARRDFDIGVSKKPIKMIDVASKTYEQLEEDFILKYGGEYFEKNKYILENYRELLNQVKKEKLPGVNTNFYRSISKELGKNLNKIERENILLKEYLETKDYETALKNVYNNNMEIINQRKEETLRKEMKRALKDNPINMAQVDSMAYDDVLKMYKDIVGPKWLQDRDNYISPYIFYKRKSKEKVEKEEVRMSIGSANLKSSVYVDNFMQGVLRMYKEGIFSGEEKGEIQSLIAQIPKEFLSDILLDDLIDMNRWYYDEAQGKDNSISISYNASARGSDLISSLKRAMHDSLLTKDWSFGDISKAEQLRKLQLRLEQ